MLSRKRETKSLSTVQLSNIFHIFKVQDSYHFASKSLQLFLEYTAMCTLGENKQKNPGRWCYGASDISKMCLNKGLKRDINVGRKDSLKGSEKQFNIFIPSVGKISQWQVQWKESLRIERGTFMELLDSTISNSKSITWLLLLIAVTLALPAWVWRLALHSPPGWPLVFKLGCTLVLHGDL